MVIAVAGLLAGASRAPAAESPDLVFVNARVWTADPATPHAEAIAVEGDRIVAVGSNAVVRALAGADTRIVDLGGRRVVPGFIDAHWHLPARRSIRLDNAGSVAAIQQRLLESAKSLPAGSWVVGRGWMPPDFPDRKPHRRYLDALFPDRPVILRDRDGHQALANGRALALAGIDRDTPDPDGGRIERDGAGESTGVLQESAAQLVNGLLPPMSVEDTYRLFLDEMTVAASVGLTSLQDASEGLTDSEQAAVDRALAEGSMRVRYRAAFPLEKDVSPARLKDLVARSDATRGRLVSYGIAKGFVDGTVDARTAVMLEPYVGGGNGLRRWSPEDLNRTVAAYDAVGMQVQLHAIGDGGVRMALDAYEHAAKVNGRRDSRHRVEHVEVPSLADLPRFRELGVIASTQGIAAIPNENALENFAPIVGPERAARSFAFRLFDAAGAVQAFGSDYPVFPMDVLLGIHTAVTRQTPAGTPEGGWYPGNRIGVEAALRHYTIDAAYASFEESVKGSLSLGKFADFVVLSRDILAIPPRELLDTRVLLTVMGGRETYRAPEMGESMR
jgi:hypothetical protein